SQLRNESAELMAGICERERLRTRRDLVADEKRRARARRELVRARAQQLRQRPVDLHDPGVADLRGRDPRVEATREARIAVVEGQHRDATSSCGERRCVARLPTPLGAKDQLLELALDV